MPKKNFFFQVFEKKMNDKRNLICGNVMLLSQSRGEISLSVFAKTLVDSETKRMFDLKKKNF